MDEYFELAEEAVEKQSREGGCVIKITPLPGALRKREFSISESEGERLGRAPGDYASVEITGNEDDDSKLERAGEEYYKLIKAFSKRQAVKSERVLLAGLGNRAMTADSLGPLVCDMARTGSRGHRALLAIAPSVKGRTGIESFDTIKGLSDRLKPDLVLVCDTLATDTASKLARSFQISDAGISPGLGVGSLRKELSGNTLGIPSLTLGVPLLAYENAKESEGRRLILTLKDIDAAAERAARVIAYAVNKAFSVND